MRFHSSEPCACAINDSLLLAMRIRFLPSSMMMSSSSLSSSSGAPSPTLCSSISPSTIDENDTFELAYRLIFDDLQDLQFSRKGKAKDGSEKTDEERAFELLEQEVALTLVSFADQRIARSICNALVADADCIETLASLEAQATQDHQYALSLSCSSTTDASSRQETGFAGPSGSNVELTIAAKVNPNVIHSPWEPCTICFENIHGEAFIVPCKHYYDLKCLFKLFEAATKDETLYPPRCCGKPIPVESVVGVLSEELLEHLNEKAREFETSDRLYCSDKTCSAFLGSKAKDIILVHCLECSTDTCAACGNTAHPSEMPCEDDEESRSIIKVGELLGWKRCPGCHRMVELNIGCNHITCRCKTQFCYVCGVTPWKNCPCPQWDENRLLAAGEERVNNALREAREQPDAAGMQDMVAEAVEELRVNHDCCHPSCEVIYSPGICESCNNRFDHYLLFCTTCHALICVPCKRNRFES